MSINHALELRKACLTRGKALIVTGATPGIRRAWAILKAAEHGKYVERTAHQMETRHDLIQLLRQRADVVICDGLPVSARSNLILKSLITGGHIEIASDDQCLMMVRPPMFIFCVPSTDFWRISSDDRRFVIVQLS